MAILRNRLVGNDPGDDPGIFTQAGTDGLYGGFKKGTGKIGLLYKPGRLGVRGETEYADPGGSYSRANMDLGGFAGPKGGIGHSFSTGVTSGRHGYGYIGKNKVTGGLGGYGRFASDGLESDDKSKEVSKLQISGGIEGRLNFQPRRSNFDFFGRANLGAGYYEDKIGGAPTKRGGRPEFGVNAGVRYRF